MSKDIKDDYRTIMSQWSVGDLVDAHIVLDALADFAALDRQGI